MKCLWGHSGEGGDAMSGMKDRRGNDKGKDGRWPPTECNRYCYDGREQSHSMIVRGCTKGTMIHLITRAPTAYNAYDESVGQLVMNGPGTHVNGKPRSTHVGACDGS